MHTMETYGSQNEKDHIQRDEYANRNIKVQQLRQPRIWTNEWTISWIYFNEDVTFDLSYL